MKIQELRRKNEKELKELLSNCRYRLGQLRFGGASKKVKNVKETRELRKDIARILTILPHE